MKSRVSFAILSSLLLGGTALAGLKNNMPVGIDFEVRIAQGSLGSARNSADAVQYIGCGVTTGLGWFQTICHARDAAGATVTCMNLFDEGIRDAARSITGDSHLVFVWDENGTCTQLVVSNYSQFAPKK